MEPNPLAFGVGQRSGLVPDHIGHSEPAEVVQVLPGAAVARWPTVALRLGGGRGQVGNVPRVPGQVGRLQIHEVGHGFEHTVQVIAADRAGPARLGGDDRVPARRVVQTIEDGRRVGTERVDNVGGEQRAGLLTRGRDRGGHPVLTREHLDRTGELGKARGQADVVTPQAVRLAFAIPLFIGVRHRAGNAIAETDPRRELGSQRRMCPRDTHCLTVADTNRGQPPGPADRSAVAGEPAQKERDHVCRLFAGRPNMSPLKVMSSPNQRACSVASAWQYVFINSPV